MVRLTRVKVIQTVDFTDLKKRSVAVLREEFGENTSIRVDEEWRGRLHIRIVSDTFDNRNEEDKQQMVWDALRGRLGADAQNISLVLVFGTDQI